jgi:hypothetical protein
VSDIIYWFHFPKMSESRNKKYSTLSISILFPPYSGNRTTSPLLTLHGTTSPVLVRAPGPTATTVAFKTLLPAFSGRRMPPFVAASLAKRCTRTRSNSGTNLVIADLKTELKHFFYYISIEVIIFQYKFFTIFFLGDENIKF